MFLKNAVPRLITLEYLVDGVINNVMLYPAGPAVDVPSKLAKGAYVKALIDNGDLVAVDGEETVDLVAQAKELGIKVDKKWDEKTLAGKIEKALAD